ncbi:protein containing GGDEF domain [Sulfurimonas gotlandica GD1]|uniref:Protein containing GGDEF domain n=1 Tax=Sulfurimonas gotlandica (strain DSM 19862 / JCM 16533 / GD1) TaxID=929558 RepID=B6BJK5_SULGG|nr:diguanylate cyclase [Sulfurimonas gotlandica]EDZ62571.1 putative GGDEF domain protein [Sulfurimonas gotlandica GD1]EHP31250.1 protein containing GGDEF domain [Sulfurimonas gotlandica GD1]
MAEFYGLEYYLYILIVLLLISIYFNIKQRQLAKKRGENDLVLIKKAYFDPVTELPNRNNLDIIIGEQIIRAFRHKKSFIVAAVKLLNYHDINLRSKTRAQEFVVESSNRLLSSIRNEDMLSRISDNGFIIVFNEYLEKENLNVIFERINTLFSEKFEDEKGTLDIKISIGKSIYPDDATESNELINDAIRKALN